MASTGWLKRAVMWLSQQVCTLSGWNISREPEAWVLKYPLKVAATRNCPCQEDGYFIE
jgi:hypothetical protein